MEQVDIVDDQLNILYSTSKVKAHEEGLLHKTVIAEVINSKGEMLLVKQSGHKQDAGQFVSPVGGHVSSKESDEAALIRETEEEIGLKNISYKHIKNLIYNRKVIGRHENHYFIVYEINSDSNPSLNDESVDYRWFSKTEISHLMNNSRTMFGDAFIFLWERIYKTRTED